MSSGVNLDNVLFAITCIKDVLKKFFDISGKVLVICLSFLLDKKIDTSQSSTINIQLKPGEVYLKHSMRERGQKKRSWLCSQIIT